MSTWSSQRIVDGIWPVCCSDDDNALLSHECNLVEQRAQLRDNAPIAVCIQFVSRLADRVHFVDEDEHGSIGLFLSVLDCLVEDVAQRLLAFAEVRAQNLRTIHKRQERVRLCRYRTHQQCLSNSGLS